MFYALSNTDKSIANEFELRNKTIEIRNSRAKTLNSNDVVIVVFDVFDVEVEETKTILLINNK